MNAGKSEIDTEWFATAFGGMYPRLYAHRSVEAALPEAEAACRMLGLGPGDALLDLCCGAGRHLVHLQDMTGRAVGLDYSANLLREARTRLRPETLLIRADMRAIPFTGGFDAVTNFFTSFGYFFTPGEHEAVVRGLARCLRPGGRFLLDFLNERHVRDTLEPESRRSDGSLDIVERRWIDENTRRVNKTVEVFENGRRVHEAQESVRLFTRDELTMLLAGAGLDVETVAGDHAGSPAGPDAPRLILAGRKAVP
jgi:ubiquinone/menaquinone biosynthesis C-methylase UbiE